MTATEQFRKGVTCPICGVAMRQPGANVKDSFTRDHVYPQWLYGGSGPMQAMCKRCNAVKAGNDPTVILYRIMEVARAMEMRDKYWKVSMLLSSDYNGDSVYPSYNITYASGPTLHVSSEKAEGTLVYSSKGSMEANKQWCVQWTPTFICGLKYIFGGRRDAFGLVPNFWEITNVEPRFKVGYFDLLQECAK